MQHARDEGLCLICLDAAATAGFLHSSSVHKCCCRSAPAAWAARRRAPCAASPFRWC